MNAPITPAELGAVRYGPLSQALRDIVLKEIWFGDMTTLQKVAHKIFMEHLSRDPRPEGMTPIDYDFARLFYAEYLADQGG
jgi:hypothetical protein